MEMIGKILFLFICALCSGTELTSVIKTDRGSVRGKISTTVLKNLKYSSFLGIPYGEPPVGNLRFKPPVAKKSWKGVINATKVGNMCSQYDTGSSTAIGSEDCLFINVFTPHTTFRNMALKPVMVYIFGGGFTTGTSDPAFYGPDFFIEKDVIMVSLNYRLNALGFLNLYHDGATGNMGLKDQNLALKWVKKNIKEFGGDPKKITIFGQSSGAVSVDLHVLSDLSVGLFQQSISMSGSTLCLYWGIQTDAEAERAALKLGSLLGIHTYDQDELLKGLLNASAADIVAASASVGVLPFRPTIESTNVAVDEKKFITECSLKKYLTGNYTKGPHMMGFTADEMVSLGGNKTFLFDFVSDALDLLSYESLPISLPTLTDVTAAAKKGSKNITETALYQFIHAATDLLFDLGIDTNQQLLNVHNGHPIYYYRFAFNSNYSFHKAFGVNLEGVGHGDDLSYIFYMPLAKLPLNQPDIALTRERMIRMWTNFAKYGNPTPKHMNDSLIGIEWVNSGREGKHLEINRKLTIGPRPVDAEVKSLQLAGLGASPLLNGCTYDLFSNIIDNIVGIFGLLG